MRPDRAIRLASGIAILAAFALPQSSSPIMTDKSITKAGNGRTMVFAAVYLD
jgi:hypothetical protein